MRKRPRKSTKAVAAADRRIGAEIIAGLDESIAFERGEDTGAVFRRSPAMREGRVPNAATRRAMRDITE